MLAVKRLVFVLLIIAGCSKPPPAAPAVAIPEATMEPSEPVVYVFYTAEENAPDRFVFAVRRNDVFAQVFEPQPDGIQVRKQYLREEIPEELRNKLKDWSNKQQTETSMINGGEIVSNGPLALTLHTVNYGPFRAHSWSGFIEDDDERALLTKVRDAVVASDFEIEQVPKWVEEDERVWNDFAGIGVP